MYFPLNEGVLQFSENLCTKTRVTLLQSPSIQCTQNGKDSSSFKSLLFGHFVHKANEMNMNIIFHLFSDSSLGSHVSSFWSVGRVLAHVAF